MRKTLITLIWAVFFIFIAPSFVYAHGSNNGNGYQAFSADPWNNSDPMGLYELNEAEKKVAENASFWEKLGVRNALKAAYRATRSSRFNKNTTHGLGDAVRHCVWSCEMTRRNSRASAKKWGNAHENKPCKTRLDSLAQDMDLHNNSVGRSLAKKYKNKSCESACLQALKDKNLKYLDKRYWKR